ncbi:MAG: PEP-CTERM sorting domain-containing protein [Kiloniellales bacterium]
MFRYWKLVLVAGVAALAIGFGGPAQALTLCDNVGDICVITEGNSTVEIDPDAGVGQLYTFTFEVDGVDHLFDQSFWFRLDGDSEESQVSSLNLVFAETQGAGSNKCGGVGSADCIFTAEYSGDSDGDGIDDFTIEISYSLEGGAAGSGTADLSEQITISYTGTGTLDIDFFEYNDFDLDGTANDLSVLITGAGEGNTAIQIGQTSVLGEVIVGNTPGITGSEVAVFPTLRNQLLDAFVDDLDASGAPKSLAGLNDYEFAFQWTFSIVTGGTEAISKNKLIQLPEPGTLALFGFGLIALAFLGRRNRYRAKLV